MFFVYIIKSSVDKKYYTGFTDNIDRRFDEHNRGKYSTPSTLNRGPFELIHVEIVKDRVEARQLEKYLKSGTGREIRTELFE